MNTKSAHVPDDGMDLIKDGLDICRNKMLSETPPGVCVYGVRPPYLYFAATIDTRVMSPKHFEKLIIDGMADAVAEWSKN